MSKLTSVACFALLFIALTTGCKRQTKRDELKSRAIDTVQAYLHNNLNDPASYEPVNFGPLKIIYNDDLPGDTDSTKFKVTGYTIDHSYRANNSFGAKALYHERFVLTKKLKFVEKVNAD